MIRTILDRIIFIFPTLLYAASIFSRILAANGILPAEDDALSSRKIEAQLLIDGSLLGIINGFIIIFGIGQTGYGILLSFVALAMGLLGIAALFSGSSPYTGLFIILLNIFIFGEFLDLATFSFLVSLVVIIAMIVLLGIYIVRFSGNDETASADS